ncbi:bacteriohemerythrin [Sulfuricystis multivorans]|uniref:bacteriohemerythrin n=1 Tax=Sulfuricystis multivorans TaxID=2211108 RepID=UPI000F83EF42|nr:bacteriohemerythrin [Sulfuricystis multivorans]
MEAFVWSERFETGFASVDAQHRHLVALVNRVGDMLLDANPGSSGIEEVFRELSTYAATHFRGEERLMQENGVDARHLEHHRKSHRDFVEQVKEMWNQRKLMSAPAETLHGFLVAWLSFHILGEDQQMAREIMRIRQGKSPAEAHELEHTRGERSTTALITALKNLYAVLLRLNRDMAQINARLEAEVAERTKELLQSEKLASIGQLAAGVAHEINNPIGFVTSNLGTLGRYVDQLLRLADLGAATPQGEAISQEIDLAYLKTDVADLLRETRAGLERVQKIVVNLKDFSRVDQAQWQEADLLAGLESTLAVAAHELKYKADIKRDLAPLPPVRCMPAQINQVFLNLLVNAAQAIAGHGTITLKSGRAGDRVWIEITDTGCGMDAATQRRLFEPFFTTKPVGSGTGLGLSLSWDIINKHGGSIDVDSTPGKGTTFRIWLPISGPSGGHEAG